MGSAALGGLWGLALAAGIFLIVAAFTTPTFKLNWTPASLDKLTHAGLAGTSVSTLIISGIGAGIFGAALTWLLTRLAVLAVLVFLFLLATPWITVHLRANRTRKSRREVWPDIVDDILAGVRAGISLPEVLSSLAERGPEQVRGEFTNFARLIHSSVPFDKAINELKDSFADPVADRILEALKLANEVGGVELTSLLRDLGVMLREDLRIRSELAARQSWTVVGARLAAACPWVILLLMSFKSNTLEAFATPSGNAVLLFGAAVTLGCYLLMLKLGKVREDRRLGRTAS